MRISIFNYNLPKELVATKPAKPRDAAKFLIYNRLNTKIVHSIFYNIGKFLQKGDVLVLNNTKVIPARLVGRRLDESGILGRKFKILLLEKKISPRPSLKKRGENWTCLIDGKGREAGIKISFDKKLEGIINRRLGGGVWEIKFNKSGKDLDRMILKLGEMPLPPYIKQNGYKKENRNWYQTVFAKYAGSVAAPTAGLHFTPRLLTQLKKQGINIEYVTLHVGLGTFLPVKTENIEEHKMHAESATITPAAARRLNIAKKEGKRIIACGTTAMRTLESFTRNGKIFSGKKRTDIFIYPPYKPKFVDALITNFHLPKSTLLMFVAAFLTPGKKDGIKKIKELYQEAVKNGYGFYSYGDAMLIL